MIRVLASSTAWIGLGVVVLSGLGLPSSAFANEGAAMSVDSRAEGRYHGYQRHRASSEAEYGAWPGHGSWSHLPNQSHRYGRYDGYERYNGHHTSRQSNSTEGGWFRRPYPYHLDYYKMRYGGSYEPYFGNVYGSPTYVVPPTYAPAYYGHGFYR